MQNGFVGSEDLCSLLGDELCNIVPVSKMKNKIWKSAQCGTSKDYRIIRTIWICMKTTFYKVQSFLQPCDLNTMISSNRAKNYDTEAKNKNCIKHLMKSSEGLYLSDGTPRNGAMKREKEEQFWSFFLKVNWVSFGQVRTESHVLEAYAWIAHCVQLWSHHQD